MARQANRPTERAKQNGIKSFCSENFAEIAGVSIYEKVLQVYIEGKLLKPVKWTDDAGVERYTTEIIISQGGTIYFATNDRRSP